MFYVSKKGGEIYLYNLLTGFGSFYILFSCSSGSPLHFRFRPLRFHSSIPSFRDDHDHDHDHDRGHASM